MNLIAYGEQDRYLRGCPQISFFNVRYRRHTNFSIEPVELVEPLNDIPNDCCSICLDDFIIGNKIHKTDCNHYFHYRCLHDNMKSLSRGELFFKCPMCRRHINCDTAD